MPHWRKDKNPNYLGACDFDGGDKILTIKSAKNETIQGGMNNGKNDLIIRWVENEKPWIVNNVNGKMISKVLKTTDDDLWPGKKIQLYATTTMVAGSEEECVRVRNYVPTTADMCADCGKEIKAAQGMTATKLATYTEDKYKRKLCADCAKKAAGAATDVTKEEPAE